MVRYSAVRKILRILVMLALLCAATCATAQPAQAATRIIYVTETGAGNESGDSWANAASNLKQVLDDASPGGGDTIQIWVAAGVYWPITATPARTDSFDLKNRVELYGGFVGNETSLNQRNPSANLTILSGDIDQNDSQQPVITDSTTVTGTTTNSYHVVTSDGVNDTAVLDGFTITAGNANDGGASCPDNCGGGVYNSNTGSPTLSNLTIKGNQAYAGGGIYSRIDSSPTLTDVMIAHNQSTGVGGGMVNHTRSSPTLSNVAISGNRSTGGFGGGIYNFSSSSPTLTNVTIADNHATSGGGITNNFSSDPTLTNATISGNRADVDGGGIYNLSGSNPRLINVRISGNRADVDGGGIYNLSGSSPRLINVTIAGNYSDDDGGGMYNDSSNPEATSSIIWGNECDDDGCQVEDVNSSSPTYAYTLVQGLNPPGTGNLDGTNPANDPQFVNPVEPAPTGDNTPNTEGDYHLNTGSPLINQGSNTANDTTTDLDNTPRKAGTIDLGPYELQCPTSPTSRAYVDGSASGDNTATGWSNASPTLQYALFLADRCASIDEIWLAAGTYYPDEGGVAPPDDRRASFELRIDLAVYGGFAGSESARNQRDPVANRTILSGDIDQNDSQQPVVTDVATLTNANGNSYNVVESRFFVSEPMVLDGVTITAGNADGSDFFDTVGGGVLIDVSDPTLTNVIIRGNQARSGGGVYNRLRVPTLTNVTIADNRAVNGGGMYHAISSGSMLTNVTIAGNRANDNGGGMFTATGGGFMLTNVAITGNRASSGGGVYNSSSNLSFTILTNVTIAGNAAAEGGGLYNDNSNPDLTNSIVWGNRAFTEGSQMYNDNGSNPAVDFSLIEGGLAGSGVVNIGGSSVINNGDNLSGGTAPLFIAPIAASGEPTISGDYRLRSSSPALDAGNNAALPSDVTTDLDGNLRVQDNNSDGVATVDLGPYEATPLKIYLPLVRQ